MIICDSIIKQPEWESREGSRRFISHVIRKISRRLFRCCPTISWPIPTAPSGMIPSLQQMLEECHKAARMASEKETEYRKRESILNSPETKILNADIAAKRRQLNSLGIFKKAEKSALPPNCRFWSRKRLNFLLPAEKQKKHMKRRQKQQRRPGMPMKHSKSINKHCQVSAD